jgi:hypothetical protein
MKKEHAACAIGMELPIDHPLRKSLTDTKTGFEELMDEFLICMKRTEHDITVKTAMPSLRG